MRLHQVGIASPVMAMEAFLERHQSWIESVVGCPRAETLTLECEIPFSHLVLEQLLADVNLDRQCLTAAEILRPIITRWETPPGCSPRLELVASRDRRARVTERKLAWDPHWKETPIAIWLQGAHHAIVTADIGVNYFLPISLSRFVIECVECQCAKYPREDVQKQRVSRWTLHKPPEPIHNYYRLHREFRLMPSRHGLHLEGRLCYQMSQGLNTPVYSRHAFNPIPP